MQPGLGALVCPGGDADRYLTTRGCGGQGGFQPLSSPSHLLSGGPLVVQARWLKIVCALSVSSTLHCSNNGGV